MASSRKVVKQDVPFRTDDEIVDMVARFEECRWPYEKWTHRAHLAVGVVYLRRYSFGEATRLVRQNIQRYNRTCGDPEGYHETITVFFMRIINRFLRREADPSSIVAVVDELFRTCDMKCLLAYYSPERLWSPEARGAWVEPDLAPLEF